MRIFLFLAIAAPFCFAQLPPSITLNEVLSWLPEDTETVMGANGVFPLTNPNIDATARQPRPFLTELTLRAETLPLGLLVFKNGGLLDFIKDKPVVLAVEGSRNFRAPTAPGAMRYEGCEILVFSSEVNLEWSEFREKAASSVTRFENLEGTDVGVFDEKSEGDKWTTLIAFPRKNILLVSTDLDYLRGVLSRMHKPSGPRALPETLLEWKYVDTRAKVWGLRHYQANKARLDPTSPFQNEAPANVPDSDAVGATFWFEPFEQQTAEAAYISLSPNADQILERHLRLGAPATPDISSREVGPGVVQATATFSGLDSFYYLMFGLMALMGHAVY